MRPAGSGPVGGPADRRLHSVPPEINHAILTGRLGAEPQQARSPHGERVTLLRVEFPVADPDRPQALWTWASCLVEVPEERAWREVERLWSGAPILAAGRLSERWMIEGGHTSRRGVIVATTVTAGPPPPCDLLVIGDGR